MVAANVVTLCKRDLVRNAACRRIKAHPVWLFTSRAGKLEFGIECVQIVTSKRDLWADLAVRTVNSIGLPYNLKLGMAHNEMIALK